ncbi:hypothetical protein Gotri_013583 [Gossypium trilobum]|uniref:Reverse transcriptase zinc-binding domain-containing protein n=1 Tax=Gossypium trilobum TaxID=34281 RepID=A0A7J9DU09_9ROSI|nr:hypothetical protein [Gossypium trilobum]
MEWLGHSICSAINSGFWSPICLSRSRPTLFHSFFADNLVIFGKAKFVVEEVKSRLQRWDARQLSLVDKIPKIGPLINLIPANANIATNCCLKETVTEEGLWNLKLFWMETSSGCFSIKSAYCKINESSWNPREEAWKLPWKRLRRGVSSDAICLICGHEIEDVLHAIRDCEATKEKNKNICTFQGVSWSVEEIIKGVYSWATHYISACKGGSFVRHILRGETMKTKRWIQLSSDGTVQINTNCAAVGRVLKDQNGE